MPVCRFEPWGREVEVEMHSTVLAAARACNVPLEASCGGLRACGTCAIKVLKGALAEPNEQEQKIIKGRAIRLACRAEVISDVVVHPLVGIASRLPEKPSFEINAAQSPGDEICVLHVRAAVDLGTTTIKTALISTCKQNQNEILVETSNPHYQAAWGADVLTRAAQAAADKGEAQELMNSAQAAVVESLEECLDGLKRQVLANEIAIDCMQVAGNPLVTALLCGAPIEGFLRPPYGNNDVALIVSNGPLFDFAQSHGCKRCEIRTTPALGKLVGGDITAALIGIENKVPAARKPYLYIDMGTNVECALVTETAIFVGSAPAGSAFAAEGEMGSYAIERIEKLIAKGALSREGLLQETHDQVNRNSAGVLEVTEDGKTITQLDIRALQLIKAAFAVSIAEVVRASSFDMSEIEAVYLGGTFAENIEPESLFFTGFLPGGLKESSIKYEPQSVVKGAAVLSAASDEHARELVDALILKTHAVNFVQDPAFNAHLIAALSFE